MLQFSITYLVGTIIGAVVGFLCLYIVVKRAVYNTILKAHQTIETWNEVDDESTM